MQCRQYLAGVDAASRSVVSDASSRPRLRDGLSWNMSSGNWCAAVDDIIKPWDTYKGTMVEEYFGDGKRFGFCASYAYEETLGRQAQQNAGTLYHGGKVLC